MDSLRQPGGTTDHSAVGEGVAEVMRRAALAVSRAGGSDVFADLVRDLATILGVDAAFAAVYCDDQRLRMRALGAWLDGRTLRNFEYDLDESPCAEVVGREMYFVASGARSRFRADTVFAAKGMDCYAAFPLNDSTGEQLGLLAAMRRRPIEDPGLAESMLKIFAMRIAAEIERDHGEEALRAAALAVSSAKGEAVFPELVRCLATMLKAEIAFIALPEPGSPGRLRMLAFYLDGQIRENFSYDMIGTPCESVLGQEFRAYPSDLCRLFPRDTDFAQLGAESYAGFPLRDSRGGTLGLISVVARRPMPRTERVASILQIFAVRAAAEIERSRAEQALRSSEASYRAIFEAAEDAIFVHDWDTGAIVDVNPKASETYGYDCAELRSMSVAQLSSGVAPYTGEDAARYIEQAKQSGAAQFEWHRRNKDGSLHWDEVRLKSAVIGGERRILAFSRDITERRLAEQALRASEAQYRAIFNASADALVLWDSNFKRVDVNPTYERMFGWRRDEVIGSAYESRGVSAQYSEERLELVRRGLAGEMCHAEIESIRKDGSRFFAEVHVIPIQHRGEPHALAIARDLTERKAAEQQRVRLEAQLRQAQKMEAIGHLTGGIAHDFNNILTSITGYVALGSERALGAGDAKLAGYLTQVERSALRARDLIQQMLTFSRGKRGERMPHALGALAAESLKLLRSSLPATIELETRLDVPAPRAMVDPVQIEQVLLNLCINSRDALGGPGRIDIAVETPSYSEAVCASCRARADGRFVALVVTDTGPGISAEVMDRMFEPFYSTKEVGRGSGMGLAIVHGIVHEHGGHVLVESTPTGTCFRVLLPTSSVDEQSMAQPDATGPSLPPRAPLRGRVLVVDDEPMVGELMSEMLANWGLQVQVVGSPLLAPRCLERERFDLLITDQTMPRMTGVQLAAELRAAFPALPIVLYTGYAEDITEHELARAGITALVKKPLDHEALYRLLRRLLD